MDINVFLLFLFFFRVSPNWEREWYIKFGYKGEIAPKFTYLIFRRGSTGESFFFHGLIDFMLFLTLAWRTWVPCVRDMFVFFTRSNGYGSVCHEPFPITDFSCFFSPTGRRCHFRFRVSANHLASPFFPLVSGDLRLLSTNICWYPLCDLHSFLTVTLWRLATVHSNGRIVLILFLSSPWDITWQEYLISCAKQTL